MEAGKDWMNRRMADAESTHRRGGRRIAEARMTDGETVD